jgi:hypothetical protein
MFRFLCGLLGFCQFRLLHLLLLAHPFGGLADALLGRSRGGRRSGRGCRLLSFVRRHCPCNQEKRRDVGRLSQQNPAALLRTGQGAQVVQQLEVERVAEREHDLLLLVLDRYYQVHSTEWSRQDAQLDIGDVDGRQVLQAEEIRDVPSEPAGGDTEFGAGIVHLRGGQAAQTLALLQGQLQFVEQELLEVDEVDGPDPLGLLSQLFPFAVGAHLLLDGFQQLVLEDRLGEVLDGAHGKGLGLVLLLGQRGEEDDRYV